jgi:Ca2+-binding RTX toxin-like protein
MMRLIAIAALAVMILSTWTVLAAANTVPTSAADDSRTPIDTSAFIPGECTHLAFDARINGNGTIAGTNGDDLIYGGPGNDTIDGRNGNDCLSGGGGNDDITGSNHNDILLGGDGNDTLSGGNANDELYGGSGNDWLFGGNGNDHVDGGPGFDVCSGGTGTDTYSDCEVILP